MHKKNQSISACTNKREKSIFLHYLVVSWIINRDYKISLQNCLLHKVKLERRQTGDANEYSLCLFFFFFFVQSRRKVWNFGEPVLMCWGFGIIWTSDWNRIDFNNMGGGHHGTPVSYRPVVLSSLNSRNITQQCS